MSDYSRFQRWKGFHKKQVKSFWVFIKDRRSHPIGLAPLKEYHEMFHPLLETGYTVPISMLWKVNEKPIEASLELVMKYYNDLVNAKLYFPGPHGDWIKCSLLSIGKEKYLNLDIIGQAAWGDEDVQANLPKSEKFQQKIGTRSLWMYVKDRKMDSLGLAPLRDYQEKLCPILETQFSLPISMAWRITDQSKEDTEKLLFNYYLELVNSNLYFPGVYGDWIKCTQLVIGQKKEKYINLDILGKAAWIKPTLAADLGIFIKNHQKVFFVGIIRKNPPGKGKPAIVGGIMNVNRQLDSAAFTMLKESKEESNFTLSYQGNVEDLRENYTIQEVPVLVSGFEEINPKLKNLSAKMHLVTTIPTPEQERLEDGTKRVYATTCFTILIDIQTNPLSEVILNQIFSAGDDAQGMFYHDISPCFFGDSEIQGPEFGLTHHYELFEKMVQLLKTQYRFFTLSFMNS
jgi:hypothetical protein